MECSLPKLLYGDNVQELCVDDFPKLLNLLQCHLKDYGIEVSADDLEQADIYRLDMGKNINLTGIGTVALVLDTLKRCIVPERKRSYQIQYENGGRAFRVRNANSDLLIYDKLSVAEMSGISEKLDVESDGYCTKAIFKILADKKCQVLRIEKRFINRRSVRRLFDKYGVKWPKFKDVSVVRMECDIISEEWAMLMDSCIQPSANSEGEILELIINCLENSKASPRLAFAHGAMQQLLRYYSANELKNWLKPYASAPTINNLFNDIRPLANQVKAEVDVLDYISEQINAWKPIKRPVGNTDGENI